jgi:hypothetical protein
MNGRSKSVVVAFAMAMMVGLVTEGGERGRTTGRRPAERRVSRGSVSARARNARRVAKRGRRPGVTLPHRDGMPLKRTAPLGTHSVPDAGRTRLLLPAVNAAREAARARCIGPKPGAAHDGRRSPDFGHRQNGGGDVNALELENGGLETTDDVPRFGDDETLADFGSESGESDEGSSD